MLVRRGICRPSQHEFNEIERLRELVTEARDTLMRFPVPDTFLGRKTQEPFPEETANGRSKIPNDSHR
ncbi:hypothetical protein ACVIIW_000331 [Bradyrhizobium sp. USDA 4449]